MFSFFVYWYSIISVVIIVIPMLLWLWMSWIIVALLHGIWLTCVSGSLFMGNMSGNTMITLIFIVLKGNVNPVFPSLPMHTLLSSKFSWKQMISLSSNLPLHAWWGKIRRERNLLSFTKFPRVHWRAVPARHNYGLCLTTPSRTNMNDHFASFYSAILNISIVG